MSDKTLYDAQPSVRSFLDEAKFCAENGKGFAAMCTVFPVMMAISETLSQLKNPNDAQLIQEFVERMTDKKTWWFSLSEEALSITDKDLAKKLSDLRNGLAHALSHSDNIILVNKIAEIKDVAGLPADKWFIGTIDFVETVCESVDILIEANSGEIFDPNPRKTPRTPSTGGDTLWGPSASGIDLKKGFRPSPENLGRKIA